jgi:hypothetical protein
MSDAYLDDYIHDDFSRDDYIHDDLSLEDYFLDDLFRDELFSHRRHTHDAAVLALIVSFSRQERSKRKARRDKLIGAMAWIVGGVKNLIANPIAPAVQEQLNHLAPAVQEQFNTFETHFQERLASLNNDAEEIIHEIVNAAGANFQEMLAILNKSMSAALSRKRTREEGPGTSVADSGINN